MSVLRTVTLHTTFAVTPTTFTIQARDNNPSADTPTRNVEGVQPPGARLQGTFGSGIHRAGVIERDFAVCDVGSYDSIWHAKRALDRFLLITTSVRVDGWELPIASADAIGFQHLLAGLRARLRFIPASAHWRYLTSPKTGTASQSGALVLRSAGDEFFASDRGDLIVFANGREALILKVVTAGQAEVDVSQSVSSQAFTLYRAATGLL